MALSPYDIACLNEVKEFINRNIDETFTLDDLAQKAGINKDKLKTGFKQVYGQTVFAYLRDERLQKVKELLEQTKLDETTIAKKTGFKSVKGLLEAFKKQYNYLPHTIRKSK